MSFNSKYTGAQVEEVLDNTKNYSANDILTKLQTIDGEGSGLDADLLDGLQPSELNVGSATKLKTPRTIWGQSFDGTGNVNGNMTGVGIVNSFLNIIQDNSSVSHLFLTNPTSDVDYGHIYVSNYDNSRKDRPLVLQNGYGNVGIGTANPTTRLDVYGSIHAADDIQLDNGSKIVIKDNNNIYRRILTFNDQKLLLIGDNITPGYTTVIDGESIHLRAFNYAYGVYVNSYGHVGIANTSPRYTLDVTGSIHSSGSITQDSDINLKDKIKDVLLSINEIAEAPLFEFTYKSDKDKRIHVGTSAQYWIEKNNWFCEKQDNGYYDMEIQNLALASAISIAKEFKKYKEETESTISSMKKEIEELKQIVLNMNK